MKYYITVDGGTTNTRVSLVKDLCVLETVKIALGARAGMDGNAPLKAAIKEAIQSLLSRFSLSESAITRVLASGMITSEFGLCTLPHLPAPAGIEELHGAMHETSIPEITSIPFVFLRGVICGGECPTDTDMMRGEETELMGLWEEGETSALYVLPGSHSKLIQTDAHGRIQHFCTMLTGEMIAALAEHTILRDAVDLRTDIFDKESLCMGYRYTRDNGLNEALFKVRILKNRFAYAPEKTYSFFLGAVLSAEIDAIIASPVRRVIVGGRAQIKHATAALLQAFSTQEILTVSDEHAANAATRGMIRIYEYGEASSKGTP